MTDSALPGSMSQPEIENLMAERRTFPPDPAFTAQANARQELYDEAERDFFYASLLHIGEFLVQEGKPVVFDATANRRAYRDAARKRITRFAEIYVETPLEVCAARDPKGLYRGKNTTTLPGAQAPYEPPLAAELVVHGDRGTPRESAAAILALLERRAWLQ